MKIAGDTGRKKRVDGGAWGKALSVVEPVLFMYTVVTGII